MPLPPQTTPLPDPNPRPDEGRHHRESTASVRLKAQRLRRALDADRLDDAIKIAADVAAELRSPAATELSPKAYYDVYLSVCAELRLLEMYVMESARRGAPVLELYERVQETPLVLPRLYLLVTAGSVYVKSLQAPAKDVLRDLVEMCAGVQHPQRGLFLRAYLAQMMKDKLPDAGLRDDTAEEEDLSGGTVHDSIDFVIRNFTEMNRLWVRMQNDASPREMELREKERLELRLLVGSNVATLSRLVGSSLSVYRDSVLPAVLEQIVSCNDAIAQEYLADCVAQVFPDEFQLETLEAFMQTCGKLVKGVNMRTILVSIVDRLTRFVGSSAVAKQAARDAHAFQVFREQLPGVVKRQGSSLALTDRLRIYVSLMKFALEAEAERVDYVDDVLGFCVKDVGAFVNGEHGAKDGLSRMSSRHAEGRAQRSLHGEDERLAVQVLTKPLDRFKSVGWILKLENFVVLQRFLRYENQKALAARLLESTAGYTPCIGDVGTLEKLFQYVAPLVQDKRVDEGNGEQKGRDEAYEKFDVASLTHHHEYVLASMPVSHSSTHDSLASAGSAGSAGAGAGAGAGDGEAEAEAEDEDEDTFEKKQELVARIVYLCADEEVARTVQLYAALRQELLRGGGRRMRVTMPSLVFASLRLALRVGAGAGGGATGAGAEEGSGAGAETGTGAGEAAERIVRFAGESVKFLPESCALLSLRLRLHVAGTAASVGGACGRLVYDNMSAAFVAFEEHVTGSREQHTALELLIVRLGAVGAALDAASLDALCTRAVKHAGRALTRSDQCVLLCLCAQLFGRGAGAAEGAARALGCVQRAADAAARCADAAERVLLLLDVARTAAALHEAGGCDACADGTLGGVLRAARGAVSARRAKGSALGKVAAARYQRLVAHIRARLPAFAALDASEL